MLDRIFTKIRGWLYNMGLLRGIRNIVGTRKGKQVITSDAMDNLVTLWARWYAGDVPGFHDMTYTVQGVEKKRRRRTLKMAKIVSHEMAALVFNEKCTVTVSDDALQEAIDNVLKTASFAKNFQRHLEYGFALGGFVPRPFVANGKICIGYVAAPHFFPITVINGRVREGVLAVVSTRGRYKYTLLEWHTYEGDRYVITSELYKSKTGSELGVRVDLAELYGENAPDDEVRLDAANFPDPLLPYIQPNIANNFDLTSPQGISIFANAIDTLRELDVAFDSFEREFRLGKKTILVPAYMLKGINDPETGQIVRYYDPDTEVFEGLDMDDTADKGNAGPKDVTSALRVDEHVAAINALLNILAMQTGFSAGTFAFTAGEGVKTATEVVSENSKTFRTKNSHEVIVEEGLKELIRGICGLAKEYGLFPVPTEFDITVNFDDSVAETRGDNAAYYSGLVSQGLYSKKRAIMRIFDVPEDEAQEILDEIQQESANEVPPDIADLVGGADTGTAGGGDVGE